MSVAGKVVVITGGTRGIGRAIAKECARLGAKVVLCGRCSEDAEREALGMMRDLPPARHPPARSPRMPPFSAWGPT